MEMSREGPAPTEEQLSRLAAIGRSGPRQSAVPTEDKLARWADQVYQWLTGDRLQVTRVQELLAERGCPVSYASLHRFVARRNWRGRSRGTVRMEDTAPGKVAELDFGRLGGLPGTGKTHALCAVGHCLVEARRSVLFAPAYRLVQSLPRRRPGTCSPPSATWPCRDNYESSTTTTSCC